MNEFRFHSLCSPIISLLTSAAQAAVLCGDTDIFVDGRLRLSCGRSRKVYVLIAVSTVLPRSSRYIPGFLWFYAVVKSQRTEAHLNRINGKMV